MTVRKDLTKKYTASCSAEARFINVPLPISTGFLELGVARKMSKAVSLSVDYRFIRHITDNQFLSTRHRVHADVTFRMKLESLRLTYRLRSQVEYKDMGAREGGGVPELYFRQKLGAKSTHLKKVSPSASVELFHPINFHPSITLDEVRLTLGTSYELRKRHEAVLFVMLKQELNVPDPHRVFIVGVGYELDL